MGRSITSDQRTLYAVTLFLVKNEAENIEENFNDDLTAKKSTNSDSISNGVISKVWNFFKGAVSKFFSTI